MRKLPHFICRDNWYICQGCVSATFQQIPKNKFIVIIVIKRIPEQLSLTIIND